MAFYAPPTGIGQVIHFGFAGISHLVRFVRRTAVFAFLTSFLFLLAVACGSSSSPTSPTVARPTAVTPTVPTVPSTPVGGWSETFSGTLSSRWMVSNYGLGVGDTHFTADNVDLSQGMLGLRLTQLASGVGVISNGAEVQSVEKYGFGTYMWRARMSSTADSPFGPGEPRSGATSGVFVYTTGSQTEIDFENEDAYPEWVHLVTWLNGHQVSQSANVGASIYRDFHEYSVVWISQSVVYSVDGRPVATETSHVPQVPAYVMMNHWGTNSADWGGTFTAGTRWMWVHSFSFVPK